MSQSAGAEKTWRSLKSKNTLVAPNRAVTPVVKTYFLKVVNGVEHLLRENNSEDFELNSEVFHNETKEVVADGNYYMLTKNSFQQLWIIVSESITTRPILANHSASGNHESVFATALASIALRPRSTSQLACGAVSRTPCRRLKPRMPQIADGVGSSVANHCCYFRGLLGNLDQSHAANADYLSYM